MLSKVRGLGKPRWAIKTISAGAYRHFNRENDEPYNFDPKCQNLASHLHWDRASIRKSTEVDLDPKYGSIVSAFIWFPYLSQIAYFYIKYFTSFLLYLLDVCKVVEYVEAVTKHYHVE